METLTKEQVALKIYDRMEKYLNGLDTRRLHEGERHPIDLSIIRAYSKREAQEGSRDRNRRAFRHRGISKRRLSPSRI